MPVVPEPFAPAAERLGIDQDEVFEPPGVAEGARRPAPRRGDPLPPPRRLLRQRHGRLEGARGRGARDRPADGRHRGISHCYQRPTYPDWPYAVFTMAHGRSKEECDAILDSIADGRPASRSARRCTRSTEYKKVRMLYFTDAFALGARARRMSSCTSAVQLAHRRAVRRALRARAARAARRRQLAGARDARDRPRPALHRARPRRRDHRRRRQPLRRLRLLVGPADPRPRPSGRRRGGRPRPPRAARRSARRPRARSSWPSWSLARMPAVDDAAHDLVGHRGGDERRSASRAPRPAARSC